MLTPRDLLKPRNVSGYKQVGKVDGPSRSGVPYYQAYERGGRGGDWKGPGRPTAEEAAQDYCDHFNGWKLAPVAHLKQAAHAAAPKSTRPTHPKRTEAYRLLREAASEEGNDLTGYVYLISDGEYVKIGQSAGHPQGRLVALQTLEARMHQRFWLWNVLGEWFKPTLPMLEEFDRKEITDRGRV